MQCKLSAVWCCHSCSSLLAAIMATLHREASIHSCCTAPRRSRGSIKSEKLRYAVRGPCHALHCVCSPHALMLLERRPVVVMLEGQGVLGGLPGPVYVPPGQ